MRIRARRLVKGLGGIAAVAATLAAMPTGAWAADAPLATPSDEAEGNDRRTLLATLLDADVTVRFEGDPARDAIAYLADRIGVKIIGRYSSNCIGIGIDPDAPITLNVDSAPAVLVLERVLAQCGDFGSEATWQLRDGYIEVGTKERLNAVREVRIYAVDDLLIEAPNFDNAPGIDLDTILDGGDGGGTGGGGLGGGGGSGIGGPGGGGLGDGGFGSPGGGGSGNGGFGNPFTEQGDEPDRTPKPELAEDLIDIITESIEPDVWARAGGLGATIRYWRGAFIVHAPDYVHRQLGWYATSTGR